jgi:hypothetical protein
MLSRELWKKKADSAGSDGGGMEVEKRWTEHEK